jgi:hypothetical protein
LHRKASLLELAYQDISPVDEIQEYRPTDAAECGIEESVGDVFVGSNNRSNLGGYSTRSRKHKTGAVKTHKSELWQPTE